MAGGLNAEFLKDPLAFLGTHLISVDDSNMTTGSKRVGFYADKERVLLREFIGTPSKRQNPFYCYFLRAMPDSVNEGIGFSRSDEKFFFTSTLSRCQFLAYGASTKSLCVQHNNNLSRDAQLDYDTLHGPHARDAVSVRVHSGGAYDIGRDDVGNVVGINSEGGWDFYFQKIERRTGGGAKTISVTKLTP